MTENRNAISTNPAAVQPRSRIVNILAWVIVLVPLGWGIYLAAHRASRWFKSQQ